MKHSRLALLAALAGVASCGDNLVLVTNDDSAIRVVNASQAPLTVFVDGAAAGTVPAASISGNLPVVRGSHQVSLSAVSGASASVTVQAVTGQTATAVATPSGASLSATVLVDTGSVVPAGKSKLRVAHFASGGQAVEFWRTQPDFQTPVHIMTPFAYQATSPYLQSDPGNWEVFVTAPGGTAKLATTGPVNVPSGERRTVVLVDSAGVLRFRVIAE